LFLEIFHFIHQIATPNKADVPVDFYEVCSRLPDLLLAPLLLDKHASAAIALRRKLLAECSLCPGFSWVLEGQ